MYFDQGVEEGCCNEPYEGELGVEGSKIGLGDDCEVAALGGDCEPGGEEWDAWALLPWPTIVQSIGDRRCL